MKTDLDSRLREVLTTKHIMVATTIPPMSEHDYIVYVKENYINQAISAIKDEFLKLVDIKVIPKVKDNYLISFGEEADKKRLQDDANQMYLGMEQLKAELRSLIKGKS